jgi:arginine utilization regulatory protein
MQKSKLSQLLAGLEDDSKLLYSVLDRFHEGIIITDAFGKILFMNQMQAQMDDLKIEQVIGKKVTDIYRVDEGASPAMTCLKSGRAVQNFASYYRTQRGRVVNSIHNVYPIIVKNKVLGSICCITDYKNIEQTFSIVGKAKKARPTVHATQDRAKHRRSSRINAIRFSFEDIIGVDPDLLAAVKSAQLAADSPSPIMIYGETGTGKELVAQAIHNHSQRKSAPYVAINCAAIPENLLEGMLFGTSKGAFTGAIEKSGIIESANGGTLLLDEINAMPLSLQVKLLRFLQERKVRRVGAIREVEVDLKIICSVNSPPHVSIETGSLRSDLFYRLAVVYIQIPPLRDRMGDLNRLITHFLAQSNRKLNKHVTGLTMEVLNRFEQYAWPGNVRELEHVIEGAMNMVTDENSIGMMHISVPLQVEMPEQDLMSSTINTGEATDSGLLTIKPAKPENQKAGQGSLNEMKRTQEMAAITAALSHTRGNAAKAARNLGISPQLLHYKLKRHGIDRQSFF